MKPLCQIQLKSGFYIIYYAEVFEKILNKNWGNSIKGYVYRTDNENYLHFEKISIDLSKGEMFEIKLEIENDLKSNDLAKLFCDKAKSKTDIDTLMRNQKFDIIYSDRYLKSPFGCLLLTQFLNQLQKIFSFSIKSFEVRVNNFNEYKSNRMIFQKYSNSNIRDKKLVEMAEANQLPIKIITDSLPHYRFFQFKSDKKTIIIRIDGGIEHGWHASSSVYETDIKGDKRIDIKKGVDYPILYSLIIEK